MAAWIDGVLFTPTLGGTTDWTFSAAVVGYNSPALAGVTNGRLYKYHATSADFSQWEDGEGAYNTGTGVLARTTVLYNSSGTGTAAGQSGAGTKIIFSTVPTVSIVALKEDMISIEEPNTFSAAQRQQARTNISSPLKGQLFGLGLSTAGASTSFGIAAGEAADSIGSDLMVLASAYTKTTGAWAVGSGNGSLDTGSIAASTWYHVWLIKRTDTGVVDVMASLSATAPTLPGSYSLLRRIGSMKTNGSSQWTAFVQDGDLFQWGVPTADVAAVNPGTSAVTRTLTTPTGINCIANVGISALLSTASDNPAAVWLSDLAIADTAPNVVNAILSFMNYIPTAGTQLGGTASVRTNTSAQIRSRCAASTAGLTLYISTFGWIDRRGRDS
jgi:hypothetical protein